MGIRRRLSAHEEQQRRWAVAAAYTPQHRPLLPLIFTPAHIRRNQKINKYKIFSSTLSATAAAATAAAATAAAAAEAGSLRW